MAAGGSFSRTLEFGHEPIYDFPCSLCEEEGTSMEAARYCEECFVFLCDSCVKNHNKFPLHRRHQLLDQSQFAVVTQSNLVSFPTKRCLKHPGEIVNIYCGDHDIICCSSCKVLEHSNCANTMHLIDAAKGIKKSKEYQNITQEIHALLNDAGRVLADRRADISRIETEKQNVKHTIADLKKNVNAYFDDLEQKCLQELNNKADNIVIGCKQDAKDLSIMKTKAEDIRKQLDLFKGDNECDLFAQVKMGKQFISNARQKILNISKTVQKNAIYFKISPKIERLLCSVEVLGTITDTPMDASQLLTVDKDTDVSQPHPSRIHSQTSLENRDPLPKYKTPPYGQVGIKEKTDSNVCDITGICQLPDGTILIVDYNNRKLKRLDNTYKLVDSLRLTNNPDSICNVGPDEVAVSLFEAKEVLYISVKAELTVTKSFRTGNYCRGMVYVDDKLYVCCGSTRDSSSWCIEVYDKAGQLQFSIRELFSIPLCITVTEDGQHLLVTGWRSDDVTMMDLTGNIVRTFGNSKLKLPKGICNDSKYRTFICGYGSNTIVQLSPRRWGIDVILTEKDSINSGSNTNVQLSPRRWGIDVILTEKDGINSPYAICYDSKRSTLLVFCDESSQLSAFSFK
ncbi:uncharacterized protein LOC128547266 [Mercenaria mercenaria]|uniref:uncharacterized protein LOC128547266 n=1 Tax=Mercenaria mercenaria TaxID=6596 RepID=UPI00234E95EA|nr:uncharacterized protein LOC128547266 [Mercenaria mercenaria]